jgi:hypothetical protein
MPWYRLEAVKFGIEAAVMLFLKCFDRAVWTDLSKNFKLVS